MSTDSATKRWMNTAEAGAYCGGRREQSMRDLRARNEGPAYSKVGSRVLYDRVDLDRWIESHKVGRTSEDKAA